MRRAAGFAIALLPWLIAARGAHAQHELAPLRDAQLGWHYNHAGAPPAVTSARVTEAARFAAEVWSACGVTIEYLGPSDATPGVRDGINVIGWGRSLYNALPYGDAGGVTLPWTVGGRAQEVDIALVPQTVRTVVELRLVLAHELGHALGLAHTPEPGSLMSASTSVEELDAHPRPSRAELERCRRLYAR